MKYGSVSWEDCLANSTLHTHSWVVLHCLFLHSGTLSITRHYRKCFRSLPSGSQSHRILYHHNHDLSGQLSPLTTTTIYQVSCLCSCSHFALSYTWYTFRFCLSLPYDKLLIHESLSQSCLTTHIIYSLVPSFYILTMISIFSSLHHVTDVYIFEACLFFLCLYWPRPEPFHSTIQVSLLRLSLQVPQKCSFSFTVLCTDHHLFETVPGPWSITQM